MTPVFWGTPPSLPPKPKKLRRFIKKAMTGKKRPDGFFPLSLPNLPYPTQSYGGQVVLAKELSMIVRFQQYDRQLAVYHRKQLPPCPKGSTICQELIFSALCGFLCNFSQIFNCNFWCFLVKSRNERFLLCDFEDIIENINALVVLGVLIYTISAGKSLCKDRREKTQMRQG